MPPPVLPELYEIIRRAPRPSDLFEQLCECVVNGMGFQRVYRRRGTEHGRDIDARLAGMKWFFECKFVQEDVDTAQFAYKFLQLDMLKKSQRPDFFVLLSNGAITSILKDIVQFKALDRYTTYRVELWANHDSDHKGTNLTGVDPDTGRVTRLFHPRRDRWEDHFAREGAGIAGRTSVGRTTLWLLEMNTGNRFRWRALLLRFGLLD